MCECGCTSNDLKYKFPGPGESFYVLTLSGACTACDAPSGVIIELIEPGTALFKDYSEGQFLDGDLPFEQWPNSKAAPIVCGMLRSEFKKALQPHLVGINKDLFDEETQAVDADGADEILEEAYDDAQVTPRLVFDKEKS